MNYLCISIILSFLSCSSTQKSDVNICDTIKEIWVYECFSEMGYTTASAYGELWRLAQNNTSKFKLEHSDIDSLCSILSEVKSKKTFQTKMGGKLIFAEIITKNNIKLRMIIGCNFISIDAKRDYWIKDNKKQKHINNFRNIIIEKHFP